jgi:hypothetical protein
MENSKDTHLKNPHVIASAVRNAALGRSSFFGRCRFRSWRSHIPAPSIDLQRAAITSIHNVIDNQDSSATSGYNVPLNWVSETDPYFGSALAKHLTVPVLLAEPATGIKILVDVNRPAGSDFDVYYRTLETGADTPITARSWVAASKIEPSSNHGNVPIATDAGLFREYRYTIGGDYVGALVPFSSYQIKIVMHSTRSTFVPRFKALRTIALGT